MYRLCRVPKHFESHSTKNFTFLANVGWVLSVSWGRYVDYFHTGIVAVILFYLQSKKVILNKNGIRRITFLFCKDRLFPKFFTFRAKTNVRMLA